MSHHTEICRPGQSCGDIGTVRHEDSGAPALQRRDVERIAVIVMVVGGGRAVVAHENLKVPVLGATVPATLSPMIEVSGVVKDLEGERVLRELSFEAPHGEVTGLLGPNGAGKTTTMRVLATLLRPDLGEVRLDGVDAVADPLEARRRLGLVTEEPGLYDRLTVREQLIFVARSHGLSAERARSRLDEVAELVQLGPELDRRAGALSKGNRQKVSLSRALIHDPPVLLLDEPTSGLDVVASAGLERLLAEGDLTSARTVLLATHRVDEAERLATRCVGLVDGVVVVDARTDTLAADGETFREAFVRLLGEASVGAAAS